jgi:hypothetical protein
MPSTIGEPRQSAVALRPSPFGKLKVRKLKTLILSSSKDELVEG